MGGKRIIPIKQQRPPYWIENKCDNQLYLSVYHITKDTSKDYLKQLVLFDPTYMIVYPSSCSVLAEYVLQNKLDVPKNLKVIFSNAEFLSKLQKEIISRAFKTKVVDTYGSVEMVCAGSECAEGNLHLWPDCAKVEVLRDDEDVQAGYGIEGRIVATGFGNYCMPLIRYDTGDRGVVADRKCLCGRSMPVLEKISGRFDDLLTLKDGRKIFWINPCFYGLSIKNSQVIQEHCGKIRVLIEPDSSFSGEHENKLKNNFIVVLGEEDICIEKVKFSDFERTENNKIKSVIRKYE
jgi:phenylacetate-CoA ligase